MNANISREEAIDRLAQHLHLTMERFDPSEDEDEWASLSSKQKEFYRACIRELLIKRDFVLKALSESYCSFI